MKRILYGFLLFSAGLMLCRDAASLALDSLNSDQQTADRLHVRR